MTQDGSGGSDVILAETRGRVRILTFNRPEMLNAFNHALVEATARALEAAAADDSIHVTVITGAGRAFTSGADLSDMDKSGKAPRPVGVRNEQGLSFDRLQAAAEKFPKPLIGAVNGLGVGLGFTILGYCDFTYVAESARLRTPFSQLGLSPEASSSYLFPLRMGWSAAARALMLGEWFTAEDLVACGMAKAAVPDDRLMDTVMEFAGRLAECPLQSLRATKALMLEAHLPHIRAIRDLEGKSLSALIGTEENRLAIERFKARAKKA